MVRWMFAIGAVNCLLACSSPEQIADRVGAAQPETVQGVPEAKTAAATPPVILSDNEKSGEATREFEYSWPGAVSAIPELARDLTAQRDELLREQKAEWSSARADCPPESVACVSRAHSVEWAVVADLRRFLSLSSSVYNYGGGAHGNYWRDALVWDREARRALDPKAMFVSLGGLNDAIGQKACALLNREREERRGQPVPQGTGQWPDQCVAMEETVLFAGSTNGRRFDRIGIYYAPYTAGAYAEGDFEFTLPVTPAILKAVKPEYREAFALGE